MKTENQNQPLPPELQQQAAAIEGGKSLPNTGGEFVDDIDEDAGIKTMLTPIVSVMCAIFCPNWTIQPAEQSALIDAYTPVVKKYMPAGAGVMPVEVGAVLATAMIVGPRLAAGLPPRIVEVKEDSPAPKDNPEDNKEWPRC